MAREDRERGFEDGDEGQKPRFPLPGVRGFGPQDATADEAAGFGAVGAGKKMQRMIEHHRAMYPAASRAILRRHWDEERTNAILDHLDTLGDELGIEGLEGAGVRGKQDRSRIITLVTRNARGRVHKSHLPFSVLDAPNLQHVKAAVERAGKIAEAREKGMVVGMTAPAENDAVLEELRAQNAALMERLTALEGKVEGAEGDEAEADGDEGAGGEETVKQIEEAIEAAPEGEEREKLKAEYREAELARDEEQQRKGVLRATEPASD